MPISENESENGKIDLKALNLEDIPTSYNVVTNNIRTGNINQPTKSVAVIDIEGVIGWDWGKWFDDLPQNTERGLKSILDEIDALAVDEIKVNIINSPGGLISDAITMHDHLAMHPAKVTTDVIGYAASAATFLMQAGDTRKMSANAEALAHHAMIPAFAPINAIEAEDLKERLQELDAKIVRLYDNRGVSKGIAEYMDADKGNGKWISPEKAKELNFVDEIYEPYSAVACVGMNTEAFKSAAKKFGLPIPEETNEAPEQDKPVNSEENNIHEEEIMDKDEMMAGINEAVTAAIGPAVTAAINALKEQEQETNEEQPKEVEVAFEGDPANQEDVQNHINKVRIEQLKAATNWNDIESVKAYQNAVFEDKGSKQPAPTTNTSMKPAATKPEEVNEQDRLDTLAFLKRGDK